MSGTDSHIPLATLFFSLDDAIEEFPILFRSDSYCFTQLDFVGQ